MPGHPGNSIVPGPAAVPTGWDPETNTRREYTDKLTAVEPPDFAKPEFTELCNVHREICKALLQHEAMAPNIDDIFMTPAKRKTKVYHMWDFMMRTLSLLLANDPTLPRREKGRWREVVGRAHQAKMLIIDTTGKLDMMCPDDFGVGVSFGEDILAMARRIT